MAFIDLFLISFVEEEGDVFQVKKSSHSKKVMKMLDRERRKKKKELESGQKTDKSSNGTRNLSHSWVNPETDTIIKNEKSNKIQTEIRTDEFVVRLLLFNFLLSTSL